MADVRLIVFGEDVVQVDDDELSAALADGDAVLLEDLFNGPADQIELVTSAVLSDGTMFDVGACRPNIRKTLNTPAGADEVAAVLAGAGRRPDCEDCTDRACFLHMATDLLAEVRRGGLVVVDDETAQKLAARIPLAATV